MFGSALFPKQLALRGFQNTFEYFSALRRLGISNASFWDGIALLCVPLGVFLANPQRRLGNESQSTPLKVRPQFKDFCHDFESGAISLPRHHPLILVFDPCLASIELAQKHDDRLQQIQRFEA